MTPNALRELANKYSKSLKELDLIGCLVHSPDAISYLESLSSLFFHCNFFTLSTAITISILALSIG